MLKKLGASGSSWRQIAAVIAVVSVLSLTQMLFVEIVPIPWISTPKMPLKSSPVAAAVAYRGARWRAPIGQWLRQCDFSKAAIKTTERLFAKSCEEDCGGNGVCNRELGTCRCFHGFKGKSCQEFENFECNNPPAKEWPFGEWRVSICPASCDKRRSMCFCGEQSLYPQRPVAESCGFFINDTKPVDEVDWAKTDFEIVYANATQNNSIGWCNVKPEDHYSGKVRLKPHCDCKYDCSWGLLCETPTECSCVNQCSGHGVCRGGFCQCQSQWFGIDCSVPSTDVPSISWPDWLRPATLSVPQRSSESDDQQVQEISVEKRRPLIYIYDLPAEYNSHLLEGRHFKFQCVTRVYDGVNATFWSEYLEGAELAFLEGLLASPHRTMNGDEADYFFAPVLGACAITRADDAPHFSMEKHMGLRGYFSGELYKNAYMHIKEQYPFWNRSSGRDHIWLFPWDEGACSAPKEIWNGTMLVHWGNTNSKHKKSTTGYFADSWDDIPKEWRGDHPCYDPLKDIVLPAWKNPDPRSVAERFWSRPREERKTLFYFNGNLGKGYDFGRPEDRYSMGIRQRVAEEFGSTPNNHGKLGRQAAPDVVVTPQRSDDYAKELSSSRFCGVFPGDGWSGRMEDAVLHGCIPVIIQDGIHLPYESLLDYESFTVRVAEDKIPELITILRNISNAEVESKLEAVRGLWQRFVYRDAILLEARRQKKDWNHYQDWAQQYETLLEDDVFATVIQALHYKLHNDPWRAKLPKREWGIPPSCGINRA
ncbi:glycosyltransferase-like protein [Selaginella moellendorffii]|uniref:Glycosyltransferase-like protein n=2 Tax=Selaginella moellendorffii TaxID=88036 RepID=D8TF29_SELML|nr:glycosyltransferase-like protein [Selaginella moellendorffii]